MPHVFNPYRDVCPVHDSPASPAIRRRNLAHYITAQLKAHPHSFWVGEAGGYRGVRRTGLLLTSEEWLETGSARLGVEFRKATATPLMRELSAGAVWREIEKLDHVPFVWAAVPMHSHRPGLPLSNRNPSLGEVRVFYPLLSELLSEFRPKIIVAIGRIAGRALSELGVEHTYVRHPSMAGIQQFRRGIHEIYGVRP